MRIKVDENLPLSIARLFTDRGHQAETAIAEGLGGASDARVAESARAEDRLLVTLDRGFGDVRAYPPGSHPGIVVVRLADQCQTFVHAAVRSFLDQYDLADLRGCITIVQAGNIRVRRPLL